MALLSVARMMAMQATKSDRCALDNAREATLAIGLAVAQRTELTTLLGHDAAVLDADTTPGALRLLSGDECRELLASRQVGRLAYIARASMPDIVPVNYVLDRDDVLIRSGPGPKLQAAERRELVAFEVDAFDEDTHTGWSVVVHGIAICESSAEARRQEVTPWAAGPRHTTIRISPRRITGRRLT
ncbi:MAG: pyridoxamine 5-phosphate oxidase-related FMN-binding protein [Frankiales bacterium]|nr:pyridoxamine 5-phosphate oxidase-related FMN-binding protein [Frankiales bacterium]